MTVSSDLSLRQRVRCQNYVDHIFDHRSIDFSSDVAPPDIHASSAISLIAVSCELLYLSCSLRASAPATESSELTSGIETGSATGTSYEGIVGSAKYEVIFSSC